MKPPDHRPRLRDATGEAQARRDRARADIEGRDDPSPRPGDLFAFAETAEHSVLWAILEASDRQPRQFLVVAADLHPLAGSSDVAVPADAVCGALCLRCGFEVRLDTHDFDAARRAGMLAPEILDRARGKRAQIEAGALTGSVLERDTDGEPEYQDWLEEGPAQARAALLESLSRRDEQAGESSRRPPFRAAGALPQEYIYANGIDATTGGYSMPAVDVSRAADWTRRERVDPGVLSLLRHVHHVSTRPHLGLPAGLDSRDVAQAGWAVVFHSAESRSVKDALQPLIEHRQAQIGAAKTRILEYRPGEQWRRWLSRHGVAAGRVQPAKVPYYLLLIGPPASIPYDFQLLLGVEYAVGRLSLETADEVRRYARSVVDHEMSRHAVQDKTAVFFAPRYDFEPASQWSADLLVKPLIDSLPAVATRPVATEPPRPGMTAGAGFTIRGLWGEAATRANLKQVFHPPSGRDLVGPPPGERLVGPPPGERPPALVFGAAHGLGWPRDHPRQQALQGALLCQDWPALGRIDPEKHCFSASDLAGDARVHGTILFFHASFSAGTPERHGIPPEPTEAARRIAREPFMASLPQRLLAHPRGGAAAVIGLVGRAWAFPTAPAAAPYQPFRAALEGMLAGWPVGHAVRELKKRYAALATELDTLRRKMAMGARLDEGEVAALWSERNATRCIVVLGDPATRLRVEGMD